MPRGKPAAILFDFDGTISTLRAGWETVMAPVMAEILAEAPGAKDVNLQSHVAEYIDRFTGIRTILQMEWLASEVKRLGGEAKDPMEYKRIYLGRLMQTVEKRIQSLESGSGVPEDFLISGAKPFLEKLISLGAPLYVASGTDEPDVKQEVAALGLTSLFTGGIFGARDADRTFDKDAVIRNIASESGVSGPGLVVFGDGPVEIRFGRDAGGRTIGVAADEKKRSGWDQAKVRRLRDAGAHLLIAGYNDPEPVLEALS